MKQKKNDGLFHILSSCLFTRLFYSHQWFLLVFHSSFPVFMLILSVSSIFISGMAIFLSHLLPAGGEGGSCLFLWDGIEPHSDWSLEAAEVCSSLRLPPASFLSPSAHSRLCSPLAGHPAGRTSCSPPVTAALPLMGAVWFEELGGLWLMAPLSLGSNCSAPNL